MTKGHGEFFSQLATATLALTMVSMSFDVFLQKFSAGKSARVNREAVLAVLRTTTSDRPDDFGFYVLEFPDGGHVEFSAQGLEGSGEFTGCAFHFHGGMSPDAVRFMFDIAKTGDMIILAATEPFTPILSLPEQRKELPAELADNTPTPVLCSSAAELESLLSGGYAGWQKYRDQVSHQNRRG